MKNIKLFFAFIISALCFVSCNVVERQSGKADVAYLLFVSQNKYAGSEVFVTLDANPRFSARVVHVNSSNSSGMQYGVNIGTRTIKVVDANNNVIYQKKIFLSTQEVKKILLP